MMFRLGCSDELESGLYHNELSFGRPQRPLYCSNFHFVDDSYRSLLLSSRWSAVPVRLDGGFDPLMWATI